MSYSETITRTDLANILNEILPPVWGMVNKVKTLTATTDANGNVSLGLSASDVSEVVCVVGTSSSSFVYVPFTYGGNWYAKVMSSNSSHTAMTNISVSVVITYLQASAYSTADYIVEQGTDGIWTYRKWNSGVQEAWGVSSDSFAMTSGINNYQYYGTKSYSISALGFTAINNIQITGGGGGAYFGSKVESFNTSTINMSARASNSYTSTLTHWFYIKGTWK